MGAASSEEATSPTCNFLDCLTPAFEAAGLNNAMEQRLSPLKEGQVFSKPALLGLASEDITVTLSEDNATLDNSKTLQMLNP